MASAQVTIHSTQFPERVRRELFESLRARRVNHKFHYDSYKQTQKWLALHQAYSPSRNDPDCASIYERSFAAAAARVTADRVHLIGLGCGGGQKDTRLLSLLRDAGNEVCYTPCDVSTPMVLVARHAAMAVIPETHCYPLVCDLATVEADASEFQLPAAAGGSDAGRKTQRLLTFLGMLPNFEPAQILPRLARLLRPDDCLLLSANLAPGHDYAAGVRRILPLYDNALTRDWLSTFLLDLGVERSDGELRFVVEDLALPPDRLPLKRVAAYFEFRRVRKLSLDDQVFEFRVGESIRLFFSYRHTPALVKELLEPHGLQVLDQWTSPSEEEGVFLVAQTAFR